MPNPKEAPRDMTAKQEFLAIFDLEAPKTARRIRECLKSSKTPSPPGEISSALLECLESHKRVVGRYAALRRGAKPSSEKEEMLDQPS